MKDTGVKIKSKSIVRDLGSFAFYLFFLGAGLLDAIEVFMRIFIFPESIETRSLIRFILWLFFLVSAVVQWRVLMKRYQPNELAKSEG